MKRSGESGKALAGFAHYLRERDRREGKVSYAFLSNPKKLAGSMALRGGSSVRRNPHSGRGSWEGHIRDLVKGIIGSFFLLGVFR